MPGPITCGSCGHSSWTNADSAPTRCGTCRKAVTVPKTPAPDVLLLSCGHVSMHWDEGVLVREDDQWLWTCIESEAEGQEAIRVVAAMSGYEAESMTDEQFEALIERGTPAVATRYGHLDGDLAALFLTRGRAAQGRQIAD